MRRKDREVTDFNEIVKIIDECEVLRLGLADGDFPYIVPVNFGYEVDGEQMYFYFHGAKEGRKYELLSKNPCCSFEMDIQMKIDCVEETGDVTTRYKSVMGTAEVEFLEGEEKKTAIEKYLMGRYEETRNFEYKCARMEHTALVRLRVTDIIAKVNAVK